MIHLSQSEENYIKTIYHLSSSQKSSVGTNDIAKQLNTKASSVTDMIKRLSEKEIIYYEKYKGCELTEKGVQLALKTIRKHRLWETFLVEKLNFGWDEVHDIAEQLEHIQSPKLTDKLDKFLNFPKLDPHGDPIPTKDGVIPTRGDSINLIDLEVGKPATIVGVDDSSPAFLKYLNKHNIELGDDIQIIERYKFDDSAEVLLKGITMNLSIEALSRIRVKSK